MPKYLKKNDLFVELFFKMSYHGVHQTGLSE
jgi:hypothetical protein